MTIYFLLKRLVVCLSPFHLCFLFKEILEGMYIDRSEFAIANSDIFSKKISQENQPVFEIAFQPSVLDFTDNQ